MMTLKQLAKGLATIPTATVWYLTDLAEARGKQELYTRQSPRKLKERWVHPLVAVAAFNLDSLCIHPFRDGNGRVSRLVLLLQSYQLGYQVGRHISLERLIEENKER